MKEKVYVDRLFADYEDTQEMMDFKEEIAGNLKERVRELASKGLDEQESFEKATAELGDITAIADDAGRRKRNEAIGQMYMGSKVPVTKRTAAGLTVAAGLLLLALGMILIAFLGDKDNVLLPWIAPALLSVACGLFVYFGLTQETASHHPMKNGRATAYGVVCTAGVLGAGLAVAAFASGVWKMSDALIVKVAFIIPAICGLIFLLATESERRKPWLKAMVERDIENSMKYHADMVDPVKAAKFGVASGGLWLLAASVFLTLLFVAGWPHSWLVFPFTLAVQVFMVASIFVREK